jgi:signal transduction histidine kinase
VSFTPAHIAVALLWALLAAAALWLLTTPFRRSFLGMSISVSLTGTAAAVGALVGGVRTMLVPVFDQVTLVAIAAIAAIAGTVAAAAVARRLNRDSRLLRTAVDDLARGEIPADDGNRLTTALDDARDTLRITAARLAESQRRERMLESSRRELVAWVSHDLRTPLAGLRAMAEALEDGIAADPDTYYKQIALSVERLSGMVDDLFDLSRIHVGGFPSATQPVAVVDLVSDCVAALTPVAEAQHVQLVSRSSASATINGNAAELNRALGNIIMNAIRHTPSGCTVAVTFTDSTQASDDEVWVTVADECGGIAAEDLPRLFDIGFRAEQSRTTRAENPAGAGLGLAISRGIIEAHGGTIQVANTEIGCQFRVALPRA